MPLTSFYTALTGINNNSLAINVIGDNLANLNTIAFKAGSASFSELLAGMTGTGSTGNPISFGMGSTLNGITRNFSEGTALYTGNSINAAINGNGFFVVSIKGGLGFTRAGNFQMDKEGNLISGDGFELMGYRAVNGQIDTNQEITPIEIRMGQLIHASQSTTMALTANLDSATAVGDTFSQTSKVIDSLGATHEVRFSFQKTGVNAWNWSATIPSEDTGGAVGGATAIGSGALTFDGGGILTGLAANPTLNIAGLANGAYDMDVTFGILDIDGNPIISQNENASACTKTTQDGIEASGLIKITIDGAGVLVGTTENGQSIALAQLALATFPKQEGLQKYQGSTFASFTSAGDPSIGPAGTGGRGIIKGGFLEQSNVDMAQEFINLIVAQRAYQANSRMITTTDELYQESINLKR
jgi:flagellar hook protein FlgE